MGAHDDKILQKLSGFFICLVYNFYQSAKCTKNFIKKSVILYIYKIGGFGYNRER